MCTKMFPCIRPFLWVGCFFILLGLFSCKPEKETPVKPAEEITFKPPSHFPAPLYDFATNPVTTKGFELGRALFYEPKLSRDGSVDCSFCHEQSAGFTQHGHDVSHGIDDRLGKRNSQPIMNKAWQNNFFWDGGAFHLDVTPVNAITNPVEMDESIANVLEKLRNDKDYPRLFKDAFGSPEITSPRFFQAMAQFMLMCNSWESKWDKVQQGETTFTDVELAGEAIFTQKCAACHPAPLFTDHSFRNNGLRPTRVDDKGRYEITHSPQDMYAFKVPSLRNWRYTSPFMHDGRFFTLDAVLNHYENQVIESHSLDPLLKQNGQLGISLSSTEKDNLKAFLNTLNDETFVKNPLLASPRR